MLTRANARRYSYPAAVPANAVKEAPATPPKSVESFALPSLRPRETARLTEQAWSLTAHSVAGGGWLITSGEGVALWVDPASRPSDPSSNPERGGEVERIAALGRALLLHREAPLGPEAVTWLLDSPHRIACLIDFLAASEEISQVLSTPLSVTFTAAGQVNWRFLPESHPAGPTLVAPRPRHLS